MTRSPGDTGLPDHARLPDEIRAQVTGLVLAGGLGRRMSADGAGVDKGLAPLRGRPMVAHVIERLAPQVGALLINANRNADRYAAFGHPVIPDAIEGYAGPLAGLHAGMRAATTPWVVTAPCDSPFLPEDLVARLWHALQGASGGPAQLAVARTSDGQAHPVFALVDRSLLANLETFLGSGRRKIDAWYAPLRVVEVDFPDEAAFRNINTQEELQQNEAPPARG
jgi:molybdopterin-guanine dinucleotide biosynthesis protein A